MPRAEYRGGGKLATNISTMDSRWDAEWSLSRHDADVSYLAENENWARIRENVTRGRILEAGCGIARWVAFLDSVGYEAYGLDYSVAAIEGSLTRWPNLRLSQGNLRDLPYEDEFFDGIVSFGAIEHDINGPEAALAEMYRVLRPRGKLYCTVPCMNWIRRAGYLSLQNWIVCNATIRRLTGRAQDVQFFEYVFTPAEYEAILSSIGFTQIEVAPLNPYCIEHKRSLTKNIIRIIHKSYPWFQAHMMAAICSKPSRGPAISMTR